MSESENNRDTAAGKTEPEKPGEKETPKPKLTKEEQMAAFEKAMKEEDWGHQPC